MAIILRRFPGIVRQTQKYVDTFDNVAIIHALIVYVSTAKSADDVMYHLVSINEGDERIDEDR
jgi:hypothetical protein